MSDAATVRALAKVLDYLPHTAMTRSDPTRHAESRSHIGPLTASVAVPRA